MNDRDRGIHKFSPGKSMMLHLYISIASIMNIPKFTIPVRV